MKFCSEENYKIIDEYIASHKEEIIADICDLCRVPSQQGEAEDGAPFGKECANMLTATEKLYKKHGFSSVTKQELGYSYALYGEEKEKKIGLFSHGDVVPPGDGWLITEPFTPLIRDDYIFARGVNDDKSGIIETVYAAKIIRDLNLGLKSGLVMFTGVNEETGMEDIKNFVANEKMPDASIVCDGHFPCYCGERSSFLFSLKSKKQLKTVKSINCGIAGNIIPDKALATFDFDDSIWCELEKIVAENERLSLSKENGEIILNATGISGHIAASVGTLNAGKVLSEALCKCTFIRDDEKDILESYAQIVQDGFGSGLSIANEDELFGKLYCCNGFANTSDGFLELKFNCRHSINIKASFLTEKILSVTNAVWDFTSIRISDGYFVPDDNPLRVLFSKTYEAISGEKGKTGITTAGGTHTRYLKNALPTGTVGYYKAKEIDLPKGHGGVHQPDEKLSISGLLEAIKIIVCLIMEIDASLN